MRKRGNEFVRVFHVLWWCPKYARRSVFRLDILRTAERQKKVVVVFTKYIVFS